jgi:hypothetical protein
MGKQTNVAKYMFPDGFNLAVATAADKASFHDMGRLEGGGILTHTWETAEINGGNSQDFGERPRNQRVEFAPSALWSQDLAVFAKLGVGMYTNTAIAGVKVEGETQTIDEGDWAEDKFILIENQNADSSAIVVNSVDGSVDHTLTVDDDYIVGQNEKGEYGIIILSTGGASTEDQDIVIDYDYTPATGNKITAGSSSATLSNVVIRIRHYTNDALTEYDVEAFVYAGKLNSGINFNFKGQNQDGLFETTVSFTGNLDESRSDGDQLFSFFLANSALVS